MSSTARPPYDAELAAALHALPKEPPLTEKTLSERRKFLEPLCTSRAILDNPYIYHEEKTIPGPAGDIELTILRSKNWVGQLQPAVYYIHGGGMAIGTRYFGIEEAFEWIKQLEITVISVEYRLTPEHPDPVPLEDCYAGLTWVAEHASDLGISAEQIMIAGHSAGGGLAAGTALLARDRGGPRLCAQCLIYPMLDDRMSTVSSQQYLSEGIWTGENNIIAWDWLLPGRRGSDNVSIYAAPARARDLSGLPTAWIDVGSADLFRDEDVAYASRLWESGTQVELHVWPGAWHAFDVWAPDSALAKSCLAARMGWVKRVLLVERDD